MSSRTTTSPASETNFDTSPEEDEVVFLRAAPAMTLTEAQDWLRIHSDADLVAEEFPGTLPLWCLPGKRLELEGWSLCENGFVAGRYRVCDSFSSEQPNE